MPSAAGFTKALSEEAKVSQKECKRVLEALRNVVATEVKANGSCQIPQLAILKRKITPARPGGVKRCFGKDMEVKPRPETIHVKVSAVKKFRERLLK